MGQFEYALGSKMGQVLERIQSKMADITPPSPSDDDGNNLDEQKEESEDAKDENPMLIIEESLAELKLVKDALLGNLDETQLESWLNWTFVEPSPEPIAPHKKVNHNSHRRNLSSSGLPPPKKRTSLAPSHPLG